ncbi:hypothetical protein [Candidatus Leptofilum sp.]|uniref:hypothetical protein n=1 Tax=Candidatus Leptofilum sp. TaxID=3241576 RepID=UPI003B594B36
MGKLFLLSLIFLPLLLFHYFLMADHHRRIKNFLRKHSYEALEISRQAQHSNDVSYKVLYVSNKNELFRARCSVGFYRRLYWSESTFLYVASPERIEQLRRMDWQSDDIPFKAKSEKEKVMDGLSSVFKHERIWAVKAVPQMNQVDDQVLQLVKTIASNDEDLEVREVATVIMNKLQIFEEG